MKTGPPNKGMKLTKPAQAMEASQLIPSVRPLLAGESVTLVAPMILALVGMTSAWDHVQYARRHLREPELPRTYSGRTIIRLTLIPHFPIRRVLSITIRESGKGAVASGSSVANWDQPTPELVRHAGASLSELQWTRLLTRLDEGFWNYAPEPVPRPNTVHGEFWVVEVLAPPGYKRLVQHAPSKGAFLKLCKAILLYSGIQLTDTEPEPY